MSDTSESALQGALAAFSQGDMVRAMDRAESALAQRPDAIDALRIRAAAALRLGREADALRFADAGLMAFPDDVPLLNIAGNALRALGDLEQSATALRHALRLAPDSRDSQLNLAFTYAALGYAGEAEALLDSVVRLGGDSARTRVLLGRIAFEDARLAEAEDHLRRALAFPRLHGDAHVEAHVLLGEVLVLRGRVEEARLHAERACELDPESPGARLAAARTAFELCDEPAAVRHLAAVLARPGESRRTRAGCGRQWRPGEALSGVGYRRAAQLQWLNFAEPRVLPAEAAADHGFPQPFSRELFCAEVERALVLPKELIPLAANGTLLLEGFVRDPLGGIRGISAVRQVADDGRLLLAWPEHAEPGIDEACLLGTAEDHFSWVHECLTRLWIVEQFPELGALPLIIRGTGAGLTAWQRGLLSRLGLHAHRIIEPGTERALAVKRLHALSNPVAGLFVAPMTVEYLRRRLRRPDAHAQRRLYLSRAGLRGRQLANESEVWTLLEGHGFERVDPAGMEIGELLDALASAAVVVGAEGAPMAHLFVLPRGAAVGMITARGAPTARHYCAAASLGLDFCYLTADPVYESSPVLGECDLRLDARVLRSFLDALPAARG